MGRLPLIHQTIGPIGAAWRSVAYVLASRLIALREGKCESFRGRLPPFGWFV